MEQERALVWQAGCSALESGRGESEAGEGDHRGRERVAGRGMLLVSGRAGCGRAECGRAGCGRAGQVRRVDRQRRG